MSRSTRGRNRKKRKATPGSFRPGPDPRRHVFTRSDCWLGYAVTYVRHPELREWLKMKIRINAWEKSKHGQATNGGSPAGCPAVGAHDGDDDHPY